MIIISIETSCDDTGVSIFQCDDFSGKKKILSEITISQMLVHSFYGGVFPGLASKLHVNNLSKVFFKCLRNSSGST